MTQHDTLTNLSVDPTDAIDLAGVDHTALARLDLTTISVHNLANWLATNGAAHLSRIERIELAERITRRRFIIGAGALGLGVISGCGAQEDAVVPTVTSASTGYPRTIEHAGGSTTIERRPQKVLISQHRGLFGDMLALGVDADVLANSWTIQPAPQPILDAVERLGVEVTDIALGATSIESIIADDPDLLIVIHETDGIDEQLAARIPMVLLGTQTGDERLRQLAQIFDVPAAVVDEVVQREAATLSAVDVPEGLTISIFLAYLEGGPTVEVHNETSPAGALLESLGFDVQEQEPVAENWAYLSEETFPRLDAAVLVNMTTYGPPEILDESAIFQRIPAVQDGRFLHLSYDESFALNFPSALTAPVLADALRRVVEVAET